MGDSLAAPVIQKSPGGESSAAFAPPSRLREGRAPARGGPCTRQTQLNQPSHCSASGSPRLARGSTLPGGESSAAFAPPSRLREGRAPARGGPCTRQTQLNQPSHCSASGSPRLARGSTLPGEIFEILAN